MDLTISDLCSLLRWHFALNKMDINPSQQVKIVNATYGPDTVIANWA